MNDNARKHKVCISLSRCLCILRWAYAYLDEMAKCDKVAKCTILRLVECGWALNDYVDATYYPRVLNEYGEYDNDAKQQLKDDENEDLIWPKTRMQGECMHIEPNV